MCYVLQQYHLKACLKGFKEKGKEAVWSELNQTHTKMTFEPQHAHEMTRQQRKEALRALMCLKEKRSGKIKGRSCTDGRSQWKTRKK